MERMWDSIKRGLQDGAAIAFDKAEGLTQVGRARLDIAAAKTRLSRLKAELGDAVFRSIDSDQGAGLAEDGKVVELCDLIREASAALDASEEEFEQVRRDLQAENDDIDASDTDRQQPGN
jgi:hypothetical protein